ncbi:MAG: hypothetical protein KDK39_04835 [Leptospiraceae bacterium]|nr:hypothetical protein [Leptospiraceae bacterium]
MLQTVIAILALINGGWMLFDGIYVMRYGKFFGPAKPGPWSYPFITMGVDPFRLGPAFVFYGILWLLVAGGAFYDQSWFWLTGLIAAVATLWYFPVGTFIAVLELLFLFDLRH